jgi:cytochrome c oxidase subunit 2
LVAAVLAGATLSLSGCTWNEALFFNLPEPATEEGAGIANLWQGAWIAAWGVGIFTWALMLWASFAYLRRWRRNRDMPAQTAYNLPLELLYTLVPLVMIIGLFAFTIRVQTPVVAVENNQKQTVNVVGFRWSWGFNYLDQQVWDSGTPDARPTLWLPVDEKVKFELTSPDVIHSFWVPDFLFKMDVIPGKMNVFELTPNKTGTFIGRCAELCGTYHAQMLFDVKVVTRAEFDQHMADLKAKGQIGMLPSGITTGERESEGKNL